MIVVPVGRFEKDEIRVGKWRMPKSTRTPAVAVSTRNPEPVTSCAAPHNEIRIVRPRFSEPQRTGIVCGPPRSQPSCPSYTPAFSATTSAHGAGQNRTDRHS